MQHPEGGGTPVLYIGRTVLKGWALVIYCSIEMQFLPVYVHEVDLLS
jgi:hypothetical protein